MIKVIRTQGHPEGLCDCGAHFILGGDLVHQNSVERPGCNVFHGLVLVKEAKLRPKIPSRRNRKRKRR